MKDFIAKIDGYKTHIGVIAGAILGAVYSLGMVDEATAGVIASIVAAWTGVAIRDAIRKAELTAIEPGELVTACAYRTDDLIRLEEFDDANTHYKTADVFDNAGNLVGYRIIGPRVAEGTQAQRHEGTK